MYAKLSNIVQNIAQKDRLIATVFWVPTAYVLVEK